MASPVVSLTCTFRTGVSYQVSAISKQTETWLLIAEAYSSVQGRVGKQEFHPQASHRTVLDSLPSYGSCHPLIS
ncbi:hypothetical protein BH10BAC2_BH10BAC2_49750 [soil metagenome]